jgi:hypothetical protein
MTGSVVLLIDLAPPSLEVQDVLILVTGEAEASRSKVDKASSDGVGAQTRVGKGGQAQRLRFHAISGTRAFTHGLARETCAVQERARAALTRARHD